MYFSCSLTGGRTDEAIYAAIVDDLQGAGHEVPTAHLAEPDVMELEKVVVPTVVYRRDIQWILECDAVIAEVSTPSHGVGYEIAYALGMSKPVMCCYQAGVAVSKMILGNDSAGLEVHSYESVDAALRLIDRFLAELAN